MGKRYFAIILLTVLIASIVTGCCGGNNKPEDFDYDWENHEYEWEENSAIEPPDCPLETVDILEGTEYESGDLEYVGGWMMEKDRVFLGDRKYSKTEVRTAIHNALVAAVGSAVNYGPEGTGTTGEKIDIIHIVVYKQKKSEEELKNDTFPDDNNNCVAFVEWWSPVMLSLDDQPFHHTRGGEKEVWEGEGVIIFWNEEYFEE